MTVHEFDCIDGHTCGNPVRLVKHGGPPLPGDTMSARRQYFLKHYDWIRTGLMFEPRGHDLMSGSILYPPTREDCDVGVLYIETSGCLPMCGHGTIGTVTLALEQGLVTPREPGILRLDTPAGLVEARYVEQAGKITEVRIRNIPAYLAARQIPVDCPELGTLHVDVAYGGNFYAIVDPQTGFAGLDQVTVGDLLRWSPMVRKAINAAYEFVHPEDQTIRGVSHLQWTGPPQQEGSHGRNAVFYGEKAIDRSPCGTGTSARMAQWAAYGKLQEGDHFIHESIIGSRFDGRVEATVKVGDFDAIVPSIAGWARLTGFNRILIDEDDPYAHGFQVV